MSASAINGIIGRAILLRGNDIDTDRIIPARFLKAITFDGLETHLFEDDRRAAMASGCAHPFDTPGAAGARILIAEANFGCGSSREHAPQALHRWGIRAIVAESFAEIFFSNAVAIGLPCITVSPADADALRKSCEHDSRTEVVISLQDQLIRYGAARCAAFMPAPARESFITGFWDAAGLLVDGEDDVARVARALPYVRGF